jgi:hypothetical protein
MRRIFIVVAIAMAILPACATTSTNRVGVATTTGADVAACDRSKPRPCVYDYDSCGGDWCIEQACQ